MDPQFYGAVAMTPAQVLHGRSRLAIVWSQAYILIVSALAQMVVLQRSGRQITLEISYHAPPGPDLS